MRIKQAALLCALVLSVTTVNANENNQTTSAWSKGSIPDKGYHFFTGIGKDVKSFLIDNKIIDKNSTKDSNVSK